MLEPTSLVERQSGLEEEQHISTSTSDMARKAANGTPDNGSVRRKPARRPVWQPANDLIATPTRLPSQSPSEDEPSSRSNSESRANTPTRTAGTTTSTQPTTMNSYASQPPRPAPRLQNANKTGLGASANQWGSGSFGIPSAGGLGGGFGGGAPGLGQARPGQLSGFAQVMGGGSGQGPIDMR